MQSDPAVPNGGVPPGAAPPRSRQARLMQAQRTVSPGVSATPPNPHSGMAPAPGNGVSAPGQPQQYQPVGTAQQVPPPAQQFASMNMGAPNAGTPVNSAAGRSRKPDPKNLPNPTKVQQPTKKLIYDVTVSDVPSSPPPAHFKYIVTERGNCSPRFVRSTIYHVPTKKSLFETSRLPLAVVVQPLADVGFDEYDVPVVDLAPNGPLRCRRCGAYINPFVKFTDNGRSYACALCSAGNEVPEYYFSPLELNGQRRDLAERVELWRGSVDFIAVNEQGTIAGEKPVVLFILDVSSVAITSGLVNGFVTAIKHVLERNFADDDTTRIGFITFDKTVHFWKMAAANLQMVVIPDVSNVFQPLPHDAFLATYASQKERIVDWLDRLPKLFAKSDNPDSAFGSALAAAAQSMGAGGGRIVALHASLPNVGPGALKLRDDASAYNTEKEKTLLAPQNKFYADLALECAKRKVCVDLISCASVGSYIDLATLGQLPKVTGGGSIYIPAFQDAIVKIRTSEGIAVDSFDGHFRTGGTGGGDIEIAGVDADKAFVVHMKYDDNIPEKQDCVIQIAMLYTNAAGQRLIRVHTLALKATSQLINTFKSADIDSVLAVMARKAISELPNKRLSEIRTKLTEWATETLGSYRKHCAKPSSDGQLILPDSLKLLPVYLCGLLKSHLLNNMDSFTSLADNRAAAMYLWGSMGLESFAVHLYPKLYSVNALEEEEEEEQHSDSSDSEEDHAKAKKPTPLPGDPDCYGSYWLPPTIRLGAVELEQGGIYLMDDGVNLYLAVNPPLDPELFSRIFDEKGAIAYRPDDDLSARLHQIIAAIRHRRPMFQPLLILDTQQQVQIRRTFFNKLVEDGSDDYNNKEQIAVLVRLSYSGYLCHVHRCIQDKL